MALLGIAVTGIVYSAILAATHDPNGWREVTSNTLLHYVVPILMVLGWVLFGPRPRTGLRTVLLAIIWPVLWLTYTLVHGALSSWYPYPFVDVAEHGYALVLLYCLGVTGRLRDHRHDLRRARPGAASCTRRSVPEPGHPADGYPQLRNGEQHHRAHRLEAVTSSGIGMRSPDAPVNDSSPATRRTSPLSTCTVASPGFWCSVSTAPPPWR